MTSRERIIQALIRKDLVVVVGAGVTSALTGGNSASTWAGLIDDGIRRVSSKDKDKGAILELQRDHDQSAGGLVAIAQEIQRFLGDDFGRWIQRSVGDLPLKNPLLAEAIGALGAPILTTNYDVLLERALDRGSATWLRPEDMRRSLRNDLPTIAHVHGVCTDVDSVVFSGLDYERLTNTPEAQEVQRAAFSMKTFLFIGMGAGLEDPNFSPMVSDFARNFPSTSQNHFRLCREEEINPASEVQAVVDVSYGKEFTDLPTFLYELAAEARVADIDLVARSRNSLLDWLRDNSTLWRDADTLAEKGIHDLVVPPILLPEPHDQYATNSVVGPEKNRPAPLDLVETLESSQIILIAGEESAGVSTAVTYAVHEALDIFLRSYSVIVREPLSAGNFPVRKHVDRFQRENGVSHHSEASPNKLILGVDNLSLEKPVPLGRALNDVAALDAAVTVIGVRQDDVVELSRRIQEHTGKDVKIAFLGRFGESDTQELARRVAPGREGQVTQGVMVVIREKNLPRTPFTITLLIELVQTGVALQKESSEVAVLDQYLDLLLSADFIRTTHNFAMTVRQKRSVLELLARQFVLNREDKATYSRVLEWVSEEFSALGWDFDASVCLQDLIDRRVLARTAEQGIRFQRSAYLELMAGIAAREDETFRQLVFRSPLQLASIVRTYAAMTRKDAEVLRVVRRELDRIDIGALHGTALRSVRQVPAKAELFADKALPEKEATEGTVETQAEPQEAQDGVGREVERYYDDSDDSDTPAFLTGRIEDRSPARQAALAVDLVSRVLRDSDEVRDQALKEELLKDVLIAWVAFCDMFEQEMAEIEGLDEIVESFFADQDVEEDEEQRLREVLLQLIPTLLTSSGIRYCLSGPTLITRLAKVSLPDSDHGKFASLFKTVALWGSGGSKWVESLAGLSEEAVSSFFGASYVATMARYAYIVDQDLSDEDRDKIRDFLRRVVTVRYRFKSPDEKNLALNRFENRLRNARLNEGGRRSQRSLTL